MKIFIFMFEGPISNNKEKINIAPSPQGTPLTNNKENKNPLPPCAPGQKLFFWIYLIAMKIVIFMFESPISNNKDNTNVDPSPLLDVPGQKIFFWIS